jgi:hypothetical protein
MEGGHWLVQGIQEWFNKLFLLLVEKNRNEPWAKKVED